MNSFVSVQKAGKVFLVKLLCSESYDEQFYNPVVFVFQRLRRVNGKGARSEELRKEMICKMYGIEHSGDSKRRLQLLVITTLSKHSSLW